MPPLNSQQRKQILDLIDQQQKLMAIKQFNDWMQCGLKDAKDAIEQLALDPNTDLSEIESAREQHQSTPYKSIYVNFGKKTVTVTAQNGEKMLVDEQHPEWAQIMMFFTQSHYPHKQAYLEAMRASRNENDQAQSQQALAQSTLSERSNTNSSTHSTTATSPTTIVKSRQKMRLIMLVIILFPFMYMLSWCLKRI